MGWEARETGRIVFVEIWGLIGKMVQHWKEQTINDDFSSVSRIFYLFKKKKVIGNLNKDCERLFKSCDCLKLKSQGVPCLSLMLFPTKD